VPTFRHGKNSGVVYGGYDLSGFLNTAQYQMASDLAETTVFGAGARTYIPGFPGETVSMGGLFSGATTADIDPVLSTALSAATSTPATIGVEGLTSAPVNCRGRRAFHCLTWDTQYSVTSPVSDVVAVSADFSYDDRLDTGWVLDGSTAFSSTRAAATAVSVDTTTTSSVGYVAHLHIVANTRDAGSITVAIHDSADNASFALVTGATFTTVNFGSANVIGLRISSLTQTVRRYVAANVTVTGGASGSYTAVIAMAKR